MISTMNMFQASVRKWLHDTFTKKNATSKKERAFRFFEEAVELSQAVGLTAGEAKAMIDYVYNRPVGEPYQEVGGVMITLAALCSAAEISLGMAAADELIRVNNPEVIEKIRAKRASRIVPGHYQTTCPSCDGKGRWWMAENLHVSAGWAPCEACGGTGVVDAE